MCLISYTLSNEKSVRSIGKITEIITVVIMETGIGYKAELGTLTEDREHQICKKIEDGKNYGYAMNGKRYLFVKNSLRQILRR